MSKYTTEVRYICEHYANLDESVGYNSTLETIEAARSHIFEPDYPIFNEDYRSVLETKILRHFYTREIAAESVGLWKMWLNTRLHEIMPYYNQRYESEFIRFNPLYDTDLATSRDDKFGSQRVDINSNDIVNGGNDIVNTHNDKNVTNSGSDVDTLGGADVKSLGGSDVSTLGGRDIDTLSGRDVDTLSGNDVDTLSGNDVDTLSGNDSVVQTGSITNANSGKDTTKYDDRDSSDDDRTTETWKNSNTTDWHYASDTPQSTIASIGDNNYATSFTKDTHIQTNEVDGSGNLKSPNSNYDKVHDKVEHNNHNTTELTHGKTETETFNSKTDATNYGKVDTMAYGKVDTMAYGKVDTMAYGKIDTMAYGKVDTTDYGKTDTQVYGKTDTTDYGKTDTQVYGKITDSAFDEQQATSYGKTTHGEENNNRGFHSTDEWLEHIVGKRNNKSYSQMLNEFRTTFLNIDMEVINELNDLFFNLW